MTAQRGRRRPCSSSLFPSERPPHHHLLLLAPCSPQRPPSPPTPLPSYYNCRFRQLVSYVERLSRAFAKREEGKVEAHPKPKISSPPFLDASLRVSPFVSSPANMSILLYICILASRSVDGRQKGETRSALLVIRPPESKLTRNTPPSPWLPHFLISPLEQLAPALKDSPQARLL